MNKSQLRKLALRRAQGGLNLEEYHKRRRALIDEIVNGTQPIEREIPAPRPAPVAHSDTESTSAADGQYADKCSRSFPLHYYFATGATVSILILIWALWPVADKPLPAPAPPVPPVQQISAARTLVESFLALRDYSEVSVGEFEDNWQRLDPRDRENARNELWFRSLSRSIRDEVKTQRALAQLAASGDSAARIERLYRLARTLEITHQLPSRTQAPSPAPPAATESTGPETTAPVQQNAGQPNPEQETLQDRAAPDTLPTPAGSDTATAREWLAMQPDEAFSLQIFAVNKLLRVEQLMAQHPDLAFQILATDGAVPRFRVYFGSYADRRQAEQAFAGLAENVKKAAGKALIKSFAEIRTQLAGSTQSSDDTQAAPGAPAAKFTLQLFASDNRGNALALTRQFSRLGLKLHEMSGTGAAYRVVYGRFSSTGQARQAGAQLPKELRDRIGTPLVKSLADLGLEQ